MRVLAVASGTSADGLDVALVDLDHDGSGELRVDVAECWAEAWPAGLADRLLAALWPAGLDAEQLCRLDTEVGRALGAAAARGCARSDRVPDLVVSPGQTLHHDVRGGVCQGTLQVGQPAWVVEATGLPVVSDLRARDVAAGGHGAPLAPVLDGLWLAGGPGRRVALNLGGIANVTVVDGGEVRGWDTGPANCLLDVAATAATGGRLRYDRDGGLARSGTVSERLLAELGAHPYFDLPAPKSTGRETFSEALLTAALDAAGRPDWPDVLATLVELTARTVADSVLPCRPTEVIASGGGVRNPVLMAAIARRLGEVPLSSSDDHGLPADAKEAVLWALLGYLTWHGVPVSTTPGGGPGRVLGRISPGDRPLRLPPPSTYPTRMVVGAAEVAS